MFRSRSLLALTLFLFFLGQLYVFFSIVPSPQQSPSPHVLGDAPSLSALACSCPPASAHKYRGFSVHDPELNYSNTPTSLIRPPAFYAPATLSASIPLVSVIIPYYNSAATIHETLRSVLQQSLQAIEIIIVDDASPAPGTAPVLANMKRLDERIRIVTNSVNGGLAATRNAGTHLCNCVLIQRVVATLQCLQTLIKNRC